jgi:hypothetical protein
VVSIRSSLPGVDTRYYLQNIDWTAQTSKATHVGAGDLQVSRCGTNNVPGYGVPDYSVQTGQTVSLPLGPPPAGQLDTVLIQPLPDQPDTTITAVTSATGASWVVKQITTRVTGVYRVANGSEGADIKITASNNSLLNLHWSRWR